METAQASTMDTEPEIKKEAELPADNNDNDDAQRLHMRAMALRHFLEDSGQTGKSSPDSDVKQDVEESVDESATDIKLYRCSICKKRFKHEDTLNIHKKTHEDQNTIVCHDLLEEIFGKEALNIDKLKKKLAKGKKKFKRTKPFPCDDCGKGYSHALTLKNHKIERHSGEKTFHCTDCGESFHAQFSLDNHSEIHVGPGPYTCITCGQIFAERFNLKAHMTTHAEEKPRPYKCNICSKAFTLRGTLERHLTTHTDEKPFSCSTCGKCFSLERALKGHMIIHTGVKPYSCTTCGQKFAHNASLRNHQRLHTGEKPFLCSTCGKTFVQQSSLSKHLVVHTGEKPHLCSLCGKGFKRNNHLTKHMRAMHKDILFGSENYNNKSINYGDDSLVPNDSINDDMDINDHMKNTSSDDDESSTPHDYHDFVVSPAQVS